MQAAILANDLATVRALVAADPSALTAEVRLEDPYELYGFDRSHCSPLQLAALAGHAPIVRWMLEQDPALARGADGDGCTPLHYAVLYCDPATVKACLDFAPDAAADGEALHRALWTHAELNLLEAVRALVAAAPDSLTALDDDGWTPLQRAMLSYQPPKDVVEFLATRTPPAALMAAGARGITALHLAAAHDLEGVREIILARVPDRAAALATRDADGKTPVDMLAVDIDSIVDM